MYNKIKEKVRTTLRYRLFILIFLPIITTLFSLIAFSFYWTVNYTWQNALQDVSEKLNIVEFNIKIMQERQNDLLRSYSDSYRFKQQLYDKKSSSDEINHWIQSHKPFQRFDFVNWVPLDKMESEFSYVSYTQMPTFFDVLTANELDKLKPELSEKARITIQKESAPLTDGFVSRTIYPVRDNDGRLLGYLDGGILLNNNLSVVDEYRDLIYPFTDEQYSEHGTVTIFLGDVRVSTNVMSQSNGERALGTRVSGVVKEAVLERGENYIDKAFVFDDWYISAYQPVYDHQSKVVGIFYTGYEVWPLIETYVVNLIEISCAILFVLLILAMLVYRNTNEMFYPIQRISSTVKLIKNGKNGRIGDLELDQEHELAQLGSQFDSMLDLLEKRENEIQSAADQLEYKVVSRTASLNQKTLELEEHIELLNVTRDKLINNEKLAALGKLTAGIAHEINNPITVILGNVQLLQLDFANKNPSVANELENIVTQIDRITNITSSLLQYSRVGNESEMLTDEIISDVVKKAFTLVRTGTYVKNINFVTHFSESETAQCNRNQLLQIIINLLMNGIQSMQGKGTLSIFTEDWLVDSKVSGAIIHVQDNGCGISSEEIGHVFEPFYTTKLDGTGLGLAVSLSLVNQIRGKIKIKSKVGVGSTFSIFLKNQVMQDLDETMDK